jgi:N-acetylneuraminic acid mutarotase
LKFLQVLFFRSFASLAAAVSFSATTAPVVAVNDWTWLGGSEAAGQSGNYPTTYTLTGYPGSRDDAITWTDHAGNLWLFGGNGLGSGASSGHLSDLWQYSPAMQTWTWIGGSKTTFPDPVFPASPGEVGMPPARYAGSGWVDGEGNLWLFGGYGAGEDGYGCMNDLWKYSPLNNTWTWICGGKTANHPGEYSATTRFPGARYGAASFQLSNGDFYLFGGTGPGNPAVKLNDMWKFDPDTATWTLVAGSSATNVHSQYPGAPGGVGYPGGRGSMAYWTDDHENFWIFGGNGYTTLNYAHNLGDHWRYNHLTNTWTWMGGVIGFGTYPENHGEIGRPSTRTRAKAWNADGKLWMHGGYAQTPAFGLVNDLWYYDVIENVWRYEDGTSNLNDPGLYPASHGGKGQPAARSGATTWTSADGKVMYLFGGANAGYQKLNDFWSRPTLPPSAVADWQLWQ